MSDFTGGRSSRGLLTPGAELVPRKGFGLARGGEGGAWNGLAGVQRDDITAEMLSIFASSPQRLRAQMSRRSYARVRWAYTGNHAYASVTDLIAGCVLTNGEDPGRRVWRLVPGRDRNDEPIKNPDEAQIEPVYRFLLDCHPTSKFEQLLRPMVTDFVASNVLNAEIALSPSLYNHEGRRQPGALYLLPQIEIFPRVDTYGELDRLKPFVQLRPGSAPIEYSWEQSLYMTDGFMRSDGVNPYSPADSIVRSISTMMESMKFVESFFTSGAKMGTVFKHDDWQPEDAMEFLAWLDENYGKTGQGHRPYVLFGGLTIEDLPQNAHEFAQYMALNREELNGVCSRFPCDPRLISASSQSTALGSKTERAYIWRELLMGPVNRKKISFAAAFTDRILHKGFCAYDWALELTPFTDDEDAERMSSMATALKTAHDDGLITYDFPSDLRTARKMLDPEFKEPTDQEVLEFFTKKPVPPALVPFAGAPVPGAPVPPAPPAPSEDDTPDELKPAPASTDKDIAAKRAKRKYPKEAAPLVAAMDAWTDETALQMGAALQDSIDKGIAALTKLYERYEVEGYTDAVKAAFQKLNFLPKSGVLAKQYRAWLKEHYQEARAMAEEALGTKGKPAKGKRAGTGDGPGGVDNWIESFGEGQFDEMYTEITRAMREPFLTGIKSGWSSKEFVAQIMARAPELVESEVKRVVSTASAEIFNIGRQNVAEESGDVVAYRYMAILEPDRTCKLCMLLDGLEIGIHDDLADRFRPPNHPYCRCMYGFITAGQPWETNTAVAAEAMDELSASYGGKITGSRRPGDKWRPLPIWRG